MWLILIISTTFSFVSIFLFIRLLKKTDDNFISISDNIVLLNEKLTSVLKEVELLKRNYRIINNEVKEKRHSDKNKN